jgi:hypothetical protein
MVSNVILGTAGYRLIGIAVHVFSTTTTTTTAGIKTTGGLLLFN